MLFLSLFLSSGSALAQDIAPIQLVFYCRNQKGNKNIALFKQGTNFIYQYGSDFSKPELTLVRSEKDVIKEPWNGVGNEIWSNITLKNNEYAYTVRSSYTRTENPTATAGVDITKGSEYISSVQCKTNADFIDLLSSFVE